MIYMYLLFVGIGLDTAQNKPRREEPVSQRKSLGNNVYMVCAEYFGRESRSLERWVLPPPISKLYILYILS